MATRSTIALEYADGQVGYVYCHWDGYLDHNGKILLNNFSDPFKLRSLLDLGDLSSLRPNVGEQHDFDDRRAADDQCTFYGRDRGETGCEQKLFKDFADYEANFQHEEFAYILRKDGIWYVKCYSEAFTPLGEAIAADLIAAAEQE